MNTLTFVDWYFKKAVYLNGSLVYYGETHANRVLHEALGYAVEHLENVPTHNLAGFDTDGYGHWNPPENLSTLKAQFAAYNERLRQEAMTNLRKQLTDLETSPGR